MTNNRFKWEKSKQLSVLQLLLATFLPSGFAYVGFRVVLPALVKNGTPVLVGWPAVASIMLFVFVLLAMFLDRLRDHRHFRGRRGTIDERSMPPFITVLGDLLSPLLHIVVQKRDACLDLVGLWPK